LLQKIIDIIATGAIPVISISTGNQSLNLAASTNQPLNLVASTINTQISTVLTTNDHDKSVENEQRKVVNSETISTSIRLWLIFDTYSKHPTRLLSMTEAFGEKAMMNLRFMFPDDHIPTDDTGFREFLNRNFLRTINLFSDIRNATAISNEANSVGTIDTRVPLSISLCVLHGSCPVFRRFTYASFRYGLSEDADQSFL